MPGVFGERGAHLSLILGVSEAGRDEPVDLHGNTAAVRLVRDLEVLDLGVHRLSEVLHVGTEVLVLQELSQWDDLLGVLCLGLDSNSIQDSLLSQALPMHDSLGRLLLCFLGS